MIYSYNKDYNQGYEDGRRETAREILQHMLNEAYRDDVCENTAWEILQIAKKYGATLQEEK